MFDSEFIRRSFVSDIMVTKLCVDSNAKFSGVWVYCNLQMWKDQKRGRFGKYLSTSIINHTQQTRHNRKIGCKSFRENCIISEDLKKFQKAPT